MRAPLAVLVHGRAGNIDSMAVFRRSVPKSFHVLFVEAPYPDPLGGYSWWLPEEGADYRAAGIAAAQLIIDVCDQVVSIEALAPDKYIGCGFSQGAGVLSVVGQREPALFAGIALLSGFVLQIPEYGGQGVTPRFFIAHGTEDKTVLVEKAQRGADYLRAQGADVVYVTDEVGHKIGSNGMRGLKEWFKVFEG